MIRRWLYNPWHRLPSMYYDVLKRRVTYGGKKGRSAARRIRRLMATEWKNTSHHIII
jgi:hypothetical protein